MTRLVYAMTPEEIRAAVAEQYGCVARRPAGQHPFPVGRAFAESLGYPSDVLDSLPHSAVDAFTGISYPLTHANLQPGEIVLDLGCGAGMDTILIAREVGSIGLQPGTINGVEVEKGTYRIDVPDTEGTLTVLKGKEVVAKAPCRVEPLQEKASADSIVFRTGKDGQREVARIILCDPKLVIHVSGPVQAAAAPPKESPVPPVEQPADAPKS